jgi:hypothetical protein
MHGTNIKLTEQVQNSLKWKDIVEKPRLYQSCSAEEEDVTMTTFGVTTPSWNELLSRVK